MSFVIRFFQIRRMMSVVFGVASGKIGISTMHRILDNPKKEVWPNLTLAAPEGLALANVEYDPAYLAEATDDYVRLPVGPPPDPEIVSYPDIDW